MWVKRRIKRQMHCYGLPCPQSTQKCAVAQRNRWIHYGSKLFRSFDHHDPRNLWLICLVKERKICFRILPDLRNQSWIFLKKRTRNTLFSRNFLACLQHDTSSFLLLRVYISGLHKMKNVSLKHKLHLLVTFEQDLVCFTFRWCVWIC